MTQPTKFQPPPPTTSSNSNATILPPTINQVTYFGRVYTLYDAMLLVEACRLNILPTIDRRLTTFERLKLIKPNSIFIWNETKSGMKRWTDGKLWSASKVIFGNFLQYREINKSTKTPEINGLIKQSFSLNTKDGQRFHLISYYRPNRGVKYNNNQLKLNTPTTGIAPENSGGSDDDDGDADVNRVLKKRKLLQNSDNITPNSFSYPVSASISNLES